MEPNRVLRPRPSPLARLGVAALVGAVLVAAPMGRARAADERATVIADEAPLAALGEQLAAKRRDARERLRGLAQDVLARTAQRVEEARRGVEQVLTFGYGLEGLASVDPSVFEEADDDADADATVEPARPRRLEYVEETNDPLAGL